jgi:hypothetical protein
MIPLAFIIGLILPIFLCGIPSKLFSQRSRLLLRFDMKIAKLMQKLSADGARVKEIELLEELETCAKRRSLVKKSYPILPFGSMTGFISAIPLGLSATPGVIAIMKMIAKSLSK